VTDNPSDRPNLKTITYMDALLAPKYKIGLGYDLNDNIKFQKRIPL